VIFFFTTPPNVIALTLNCHHGKNKVALPYSRVVLSSKVLRRRQADKRVATSIFASVTDRATSLKCLVLP
jgi:hypothetical protein